jgi:Na+-driven multidrug efflux pump
MWENVVAFAVALLAAAYAIVCLVGIASIKQNAAGNRPSDATIHSTLAFNQHINNVEQAVFWVMYIAFFAWMMSLNSRFRAAGRGRVVRQLTAWKVWRVSIVVSLLLVIVLRSHDSTVTSASTALSEDHRQMGYLALRAAIGCLYVWVALSMRVAARSLYAPRPTAGIPAQPTGPIAEAGGTMTAPASYTDPTANA